MPGQRGAELRRTVTEELQMTFVPADIPLVDMKAGRVRGVSQGITGFLAHPKSDAIALWAGIASDRLFVIRAECDDGAKATAVALALRRTLDSFELLPVR